MAPGVWILIFFIGFIILPIVALVDILRSRFEQNDKLVWFFVVLLLPALGYILYFLIGIRHKKIRAVSSRVKHVSSEEELATITTVVDGTDIKHVNLWAHKTERKTIIAKCSNGEQIAILAEEGPYIEVGTIKGKQGWCSSEFVIK